MLPVTFRQKILEALEVPRAMLRKVQDLLVRVVLRGVLIPVFLTISYFAVIGPGSLLARVFARELICRKGAKGSPELTYWVQAEGYEPDPKKALQQS